MAKILIRFERGDVIEILETRPNGLWRGRCGGRVGTFKFIMVEVSLANIVKTNSIQSLQRNQESVCYCLSRRLLNKDMKGLVIPRLRRR